MPKIVWTAQSVRDVEPLAGGLRDRILSKVGLLADFPLMGCAMDGAFEGFRQIVVDRYRVIYQVEGDDVRIAFVRHGARQLGLRLVRGGK